MNKGFRIFKKILFTTLLLFVSFSSTAFASTTLSNSHNEGFIKIKTLSKNSLVNKIKSTVTSIENSNQRFMLIDFIAFDNRFGGEAYLFVKMADPKDGQRINGLKVKPITGKILVNVKCSTGYRHSIKILESNHYFDYSRSFIEWNQKLKYLSNDIIKTTFPARHIAKYNWGDKFWGHEVTIYDEIKKGSDLKTVILKRNFEQNQDNPPRIPHYKIGI
jgi:hypothetical protein